MKKYLLFTFLVFGLFIACNDDDSSVMESDMNKVRFLNDETISVFEGSGETIRLAVIADQYAEEDIMVNFSIEGDAANYTLVEPESNTLIIEEDTRQSFIVIQPVDNTTFESTSNMITVTLTDASGAESYLADSYNTLDIIFANDDCPGPVSGAYLADVGNAYEAFSGTSGSWEDYSVDLEVDSCDEAGNVSYNVSDITFGHYPIMYGDPGNPGYLTINLNSGEVIIDPDQNPDTVYGGDAFSGSGTYDEETGMVTLEWSNTYGDYAEDITIEL